MAALDLDAIGARYSAALDAKPGKGPYTERGIAALTDSVCDVPDLLAEIERLTTIPPRAITAADITTAAIHVAPRQTGDARLVRDPLGRLITVRSGEHVLIANDEGDPECSCGFNPATFTPRPSSQLEAASVVKRHVKQENPW